VADLLRGDYKQSEYGRVILPFTVLRSLDWVLEEIKDQVLEKVSNLPPNIDVAMRDTILNRVKIQHPSASQKKSLPENRRTRINRRSLKSLRP
jgi:type I restriction-modification system DNA methylase subunit